MLIPSLLPFSLLSFLFLSSSLSFPSLYFTLFLTRFPFPVLLIPFLLSFLLPLFSFISLTPSLSLFFCPGSFRSSVPPFSLVPCVSPTSSFLSFPSFLPWVPSSLYTLIFLFSLPFFSCSLSPLLSFPSSLSFLSCLFRFYSHFLMFYLIFLSPSLSFPPFLPSVSCFLLSCSLLPFPFPSSSLSFPSFLFWFTYSFLLSFLLPFFSVFSPLLPLSNFLSALGCFLSLCLHFHFFLSLFLLLLSSLFPPFFLWSLPPFILSFFSFPSRVLSLSPLVSFPSSLPFLGYLFPFYSHFLLFYLIVHSPSLSFLPFLP